jgi:hypothetical protein
MIDFFHFRDKMSIIGRRGTCHQDQNVFFAKNHAVHLNAWPVLNANGVQLL